MTCHAWRDGAGRALAERLRRARGAPDVVIASEQAPGQPFTVRWVATADLNEALRRLWDQTRIEAFDFDPRYRPERVLS